jgi:integrase
MRTVLENKTNTVGKTLKKLKALLQIAYRKELIPRIEVSNYKLKYEKTNRTFLTQTEVNKLESLLNKNIADRLKITIKCFLFCCYTGLRYTDLYDLKYSNIIDNSIEIKQHKTNQFLKVPLSKKALIFIDSSKLQTNEKVFNAYTNQKFNDYIKVAALMIGVTKNISFHCARHTFATISLNLGIPLNVVSTFLGHTDLKTTLIYAKLLEKTKESEMSKWDNI